VEADEVYALEIGTIVEGSGWVIRRRSSSSPRAGRISVPAQLELMLLVEYAGAAGMLVT